MKKTILFFVFIIFASLLITCKTDPIKRENNIFLKGNSGEIFRVLMTSSEYKAVQLSYTDNMSRIDDTSGDMFFMERLKRYDKINEVREGEVRVWLYPDSGRLMKVRFINSTYIEELDKLILDDVQRWTFSFKNNYISPTLFNVRYRIVLKRHMEEPDSETVKEVEKAQKEKNKNH